ncbi:hypothetical protein KGM_205882 [Danaus plexippus plexippus]|uniref:Uncharacterized protein n=1 Tax=Danaus plexippus plexippus TaxID=278856 RepID=A0A212F3N5_DANPL|nr:hypothetical protein KGM_205882 [Danaus plexippus plexippus]
MGLSSLCCDAQECLRTAVRSGTRYDEATVSPHRHLDPKPDPSSDAGAGPRGRCQLGSDAPPPSRGENEEVRPPPSAHLGGQRADRSGDRPPCFHWPPGGGALKFTGAPSLKEGPALVAGHCRRGYEVECESDPL